MNEKEQVVTLVENAIERLERMINKIDNGDIGFSEAGDWLHNYGDTIISALDRALEIIRK